MSAWKTLSTRIAYQNPFMLVHEDQTLNPAGKPAIYGYCESTENSVYIAVVDSKDHMYLVEQFRYPLKRNSWEVVAGRIPHDEDITEGARRELLEETGFEAKELVRLGELTSWPGITAFTSTIFLARGLRKVSEDLDEADGITDLKRFSFEEVEKMIRTGKIQCAMSISTFYLAKTYLEEHRV